MPATEKGYSGTLDREYYSVSKSPPAFPEAGSSLFSSYQHDAGKMSALTVVPVSTRLNQRKNLFQIAVRKFDFVKILFSWFGCAMIKGHKSAWAPCPSHLVPLS